MAKKKLNSWHTCHFITPRHDNTVGHGQGLVFLEVLKQVKHEESYREGGKICTAKIMFNKLLAKG